MELKLKYGYKIHGLSTVQGLTCSANTKKFYKTFEEAKRIAEKCVRDNHESIVIFKAVAVICPELPPTRMRIPQLEDDDNSSE